MIFLLANLAGPGPVLAKLPMVAISVSERVALAVGGSEQCPRPEILGLGLVAFVGGSDLTARLAASQVVDRLGSAHRYAVGFRGQDDD